QRRVYVFALASVFGWNFPFGLERGAGNIYHKFVVTCSCVIRRIIKPKITNKKAFPFLGRLVLFFFHEQTSSVYAESLSGRGGGAVVEYMPQVGAAAAADNFGAVHPILRVVFHFYAPRYSLVKAWPACAAVELGVRRKKFLPASGA